MKTGTLSIHTENIFPIIKKFLYSNQEVFLRELVSNAVDATQKLLTLSNVGEFKSELGNTAIEITIDSEAKTITIKDRGIGMTAEEVDQYINQIAFSSAESFLEKYKDTAKNLIGHFGLGFYSAFMVADKVELKTLSYKEGAKPVLWSCDGSTSFEITDTTKTDRGTEVILHIGEEHSDYLKSWRIEEILRKYCRFLPVEILFDGKTINDTQPLWAKHPTELKEEDYQNFYRKLYPFSDPPLFQIHLNVDYPFTLTGILYFPKLKKDIDLQKNKIQLYSNQVFITDSVEDIVPDYLTLLHGIIDSPDIPLNVSRSYLQTDTHVRKISNYISKKVADKLQELFKEDRQSFQDKWEYIGTFVKYGIIRDATFSEHARKFCLLYNTEKKYFTIDEYLEHIRPNQTDKNNRVIILYATDEVAQHTYIDAAKRRGYDVLLLDGILDMHLIQYLESLMPDTSIIRVDSNAPEKLIDKGIERVSLLNEAEQKELSEVYTQVINRPLVKVECLPGSEDDLPVTIVKPEYQRRIADMQKTGMFGSGEVPDLYNVVINSAHPLAKKILIHSDDAKRQKYARHAFELALLSQNMLTGAELAEFIKNNVSLFLEN
jgi:molecular chaperone HtpG